MEPAHIKYTQAARVICLGSEVGCVGPHGDSKSNTRQTEQIKRQVETGLHMLMDGLAGGIQHCELALHPLLHGEEHEGANRD